LTAEVLIATGCLLGIPGLAVAFSKTVRDMLWSRVTMLSGWSQESTQIANWILVSLVVVSIYQGLIWLLWVVRRIWGPAWRRYTHDVFDGLRWEWMVGDDGYPYNFRPMCAKCLCEMTVVNLGDMTRTLTAFTCDNCNDAVGAFKEDYDQIEGRAKRLAKMGLRKLGAKVS
jgi:hypothetical protein